MLQIASPASVPLVRDQIFERNEMYRDAGECARDPAHPRIGEANAVNMGQNIDSYRSDADLIRDAIAGKILRR
jgi:hypothetical protein